MCGPPRILTINYCNSLFSGLPCSHQLSMHRYPFKTMLLSYSKLSRSVYAHSVKRASPSRTVACVIPAQISVSVLSYLLFIRHTDLPAVPLTCETRSHPGAFAHCFLNVESSPLDPYNSHLPQGFIKSHLLHHCLISDCSLSIPALLNSLPRPTAFVTIHRTI